MDLYTICKFLHILASMAWVGGALLTLARALFSIRDNGEAATLRIAGAVRNMGLRWFIPAALLTVIFGIAMTAIGGLWGELWILIGLAGFAATFVMGHTLLRPRGIALEAAMADGREGDAVVHARAMLRLGKFDVALMVVMVADMVFKPGWSDYWVLAVMALVLIAAALVFLLPRSVSA